MRPVESARKLQVIVTVKTRQGQVLEQIQMSLSEACILSSIYLKNGYMQVQNQNLEITVRVC